MKSRENTTLEFQWVSIVVAHAAQALTEASQGEGAQQTCSSHFPFFSLQFPHLLPFTDFPVKLEIAKIPRTKN